MLKRHLLMSSVKDEGPFVLEFVAHHRVLGFDMIHMASNDCSDGTDHLLDALAANGAITHMRNNVKPGQIPQHRAYRRMREAYHTDESDWVMALDVDEFLCVNTGEGKVGDLTALAGPEVDVISLSAMSFGTCDDEVWHPGRVTEQFTRRLAAGDAANAPVKSLSRGKGRWRSIQNHHPLGFLGEGDICAMRGNGEIMNVPDDGRLWKHLRNFPPRMITHKFAWYNHYPIKSMASFLLRGLRGRGAAPVGETGPLRWNENYWMKFARSDVEDHGILNQYGAQTKAEMERLLAFPDIAAAQAEAERNYGERISALSEDDTEDG